MNTAELQALVIDAMENMKARDIKVLDVTNISTFTDIMIICTGGSNRQVKSIAGEIVIQSKKVTIQPLGVEGETTGEWVLVDLGDVVIHVMQAATRDYYQLEKLWDPEFAEEG